MPASIPHKICDHFVHKFFQIGRLLSNRRHFTPFFEIAFFPGLSSAIDGGGYHKVTQKILLKSTVIPLRYEGLKIGSWMRRDQYNLWHQQHLRSIISGYSHKTSECFFSSTHHSLTPTTLYGSKQYRSKFRIGKNTAIVTAITIATP